MLKVSPVSYALLKVCNGSEFKLAKEYGKVKMYNLKGESTDVICINKISIQYPDLLRYKVLGKTDSSKPLVKLSLQELLLREDFTIIITDMVD